MFLLHVIGYFTNSVQIQTSFSLINIKKILGKYLKDTISYITLTHVTYAKWNSICKCSHQLYICMYLKFCIMYYCQSHQFIYICTLSKDVISVFIPTSSMQERVFSELNILTPNISQGSFLQHRVKKMQILFLLIIVYYNGGGKCVEYLQCIRHNTNHFMCIAFVNAHNNSTEKVF